MGNVEQYLLLFFSGVMLVASFILAHFQEVMLVVIAFLLLVAVTLLYTLIHLAKELLSAIVVIGQNSKIIGTLISQQNELMRPKIEIIESRNRS